MRTGAEDSRLGVGKSVELNRSKAAAIGVTESSEATLFSTPTFARG